MDSTDSRVIPLSGNRGRGRFAIVGVADYPFLARWKWHLAADRYAAANIAFGRGDKRKVPMHRLILGSPIPPLVTDHINRDRLDTRRANLRVVTRHVNNVNAARRHDNDKPLGVYAWESGYGTWMAAHRTAPGQKRYVGSYQTEVEAVAAAYWALAEFTATISPAA